MARNKKRGDIDADYHAIRARLKALTATGGSAPTTIPPHGHAASAISFQETQSDGSGRMAADDVQEAIEELDSEKLARSGEQPMLGNLDMNHFDVNNVRNLEVEIDATVGVDLTVLTGNATVNQGNVNVDQGNVNVDLGDINMAGPIGEAVINNPRVIHMAGDHVDDEAKIDGLERVVFNNEVTASSIEEVSRIEFNSAVNQTNNGNYPAPYPYGEGIVSWDSGGDLTVIVDPETEEESYVFASLPGSEKTLVAHVRSGTELVMISYGWAVKMCINNYNPE